MPKEDKPLNYLVVIADDEKALADSLSYAFKREGYAVHTAYDGRTALAAIEGLKPDLVILDVAMPYLSGFEVLKQMDISHAMGIMMLTAKTELYDKVQGLELGADDYITKPFELAEVLARASALMRRLEKVGQQPSEVSANRPKPNRLRVDERSRTVILDETELMLTPKEFDLLWLLCQNPERVYTREQLLSEVWTIDYEGGDRTVDIHIRRLRKKLGDEGEKAIQTVHRVGYKWVGQRL